jgi:hypothetical protein
MTNKVRMNSFSFFHAKSGSEKIISDPQHCYVLFQSALDNEIKIYKCRRTADTSFIFCIWIFLFVEEATRAQGDEMVGAENEATEHDVREDHTLPFPL